MAVRKSEPIGSHWGDAINYRFVLACYHLIIMLKFSYFPHLPPIQAKSQSLLTWKIALLSAPLNFQLNLGFPLAFEPHSRSLFDTFSAPLAELWVRLRQFFLSV